MKSFICILFILYCDSGLETIQRACYECKKHEISISICAEPLNKQIAFYKISEDRIYINLTNPYWKDPEKYQKDHFNRKWFSSSNKDHIIIHEIGHSLLLRHIGIQKYELLHGARNRIDEKIIKEKIGEYANTDMLEFFSEVYAGLISGKKYSNDIINEYNLIWNE